MRAPLCPSYTSRVSWYDFHMTKVMTRAKISATVDRELLARAHELTGLTSISELLDRALAASVAAELEQRWHAGYTAIPAGMDSDDVNAPSFTGLALE
jgi:post-segregation antitoxin (ccd killing protein)